MVPDVGTVVADVAASGVAEGIVGCVGVAGGVDGGSAPEGGAFVAERSAGVVGAAATGVAVARDSEPIILGGPGSGAACGLIASAVDRWATRTIWFAPSTSGTVGSVRWPDSRLANSPATVGMIITVWFRSVAGGLGPGVAGPSATSA